jgi:hypothetical protein
MLVVHRHRRETGLEQMSRPPPSRADEGRVAPVSLPDRARQTRLVGGCQDEVNVVGHETVGPAGHVVTPQLRAHQIQIKRLVAGFEEDPLAAIAPLRHVMRASRNGHPRPPRHAPNAPGPTREPKMSSRRELCN